jgi:hypothetical protein
VLRRCTASNGKNRVRVVHGQHLYTAHVTQFLFSLSHTATKEVSKLLREEVASHITCTMHAAATFQIRLKF